MALPPLLAGAVKLTVTWPLPAIAVPTVGAPGMVAGVTLLDAVDAAPVPFALVALTVKVNALPLARPVTVIGDTAAVAVNPPGLAVTV